MRFQVAYEGLVTSDGEGRGPLGEQTLRGILDQVMEELQKLGVADAAVSATASTGEVEISVSIRAQHPEEAVSIGSGLIRTAIHAAGGFTPGWKVDWLAASATAQAAQV